MKLSSIPRACATFLVAMLACVGNLSALDGANVPANVHDPAEAAFPGLVDLAPSNPAQQAPGNAGVRKEIPSQSIS